jgi:hypothetical protein
MATRTSAPTRPSVATRLLPSIDYVSRWGIIEHWQMDQASGNERGIFGRTLTDTNTVTSAAGNIHPLARQFALATTESLGGGNVPALQTGDIDFWAAAWVYPDTLADGANQMIVGKASGTTANHEFGLEANGTGDTVRFQTGGTALRTATSVATLTIGAWNLAIGYHSAASNLVGISVNGGAFVTASTSGTAPPVSASAFRVGARGSGADRHWDGRIGPVTFGKSPALGIAAIAAEIRDRMWNGGAGRAYPWG